MNDQDIYSLKIGGAAGMGIKSASQMFARLALRSGYHIYNYTEFPSLIRGGHTNNQVVFSEEPVFSQIKKIDVLVALDLNTVTLHKDELTSESALIFDPLINIDTIVFESKPQLFPVPLAQVVKSLSGTEVMKNIVALGASVALFGGKIDLLLEIISHEFADKTPEIIETNQKAVKAGYDYCLENFPKGFLSVLKPIISTKKLMINGNEALALGAIAGGLQFSAIYPMSPVSGVLHALASHQKEFGYIYKQAEDEISAIHMTIGASYAGARAMTATSGGGFCLMAEGLGLAAQTETPILIIEGMRPGPATGFPTWSEQGDLQFVLHAHQGDLPRIVLSASDAAEAHRLAALCLNLAEKYQCPVVLLVDKNICEHDQSFTELSLGDYTIDRGRIVNKTENYHRYQITPDGISPRTILGSGNFFVTNSDEHDEIGFSNEESQNRIDQMSKRLQKIKTCEIEDMGAPVTYGDEKATTTIVTWGSSLGPVRSALRSLPDTRCVYLNWLNPFPATALTNLLNDSKNTILIEANASGQLGSLIREKTGIEIPHKLLKFDGRPFFPEEIVTFVNKTK